MEESNLHSEKGWCGMKKIARTLLKLAVKFHFFVDKESYCFYIGTKNPNYDFTVTKNTY